jgi:hypothetical protein
MVDEQRQTDAGEPTGDQPPTTTSAGNGFDLGAFVTEGWGGGQASIEDVLENAKKLFNRLRGPVLLAWFMVAAGVLAFDLAEAILNTIAYLLGGGILSLVVTIVWIPVMLIALVVYPLLTVTQWSLFRPLRTRFMGGSPAGDSVKKVFSEAWERWVPVAITTLLTGVATTVGLLACVLPGLFIGFLLWMATYLVATRDDLSPVNAMKRSAVLAKKYWKLLLVAWAAMFVGVICFAMVTGLFQVMLAIAGTHTGPIYYLGGALFGWTGYAIWMFLAFIGMSSVYLTVDLAEQDEGSSNSGGDTEVAW